MVIATGAILGYEAGLGIITGITAIGGLIEARRSHTGESIGVNQQPMGQTDSIYQDQQRSAFDQYDEEQQQNIPNIPDMIQNNPSIANQNQGLTYDDEDDLDESELQALIDRYSQPPRESIVINEEDEEPEVMEADNQSEQIMNQPEQEDELPVQQSNNRNYREDYERIRDMIHQGQGLYDYLFGQPDQEQPSGDDPPSNPNPITPEVTPEIDQGNVEFDPHTNFEKTDIQHTEKTKEYEMITDQQEAKPVTKRTKKTFKLDRHNILAQTLTLQEKKLAANQVVSKFGFTTKSMR